MLVQNGLQVLSASGLVVGFLIVHLRLENSNIRQVAVELGIIHTIANNKAVGALQRKTNSLAINQGTDTVG